MLTTTAPAKTKGTMMVLAGAVMISFSAVFVKVAHVGPTISAFYRMAFGGIILLLLVILTGKISRITGKALGLMVICALCFTGDLTVWHQSIFYVGPGLATILANFQVLFLTGIGFIFYRERITLRYIASVPLAVLGLVMLIIPQSVGPEPHFYLGVALGLLTAVAYSAYLLTLRALQQGFSTISALFAIAIISLLTAFGLGIEALLMGKSFAIPDATTWTALLAYGIVGQVLGWVLISRGIGKIEASKAGLILLLQPTLSFIWDILFFKRPTGMMDLTGAVLALLAIYLGSTSRHTPAES